MPSISHAVAESSRLDSYDGITADELARRGSVARVELYGVVGSTMDEAHALATEGAPAGTVVLADSQKAGRGRNGKRWTSPPRGVWMTLIERPPDASAIDVLSLRIGLAAARALDAFTSEPVRVKWPNDLFVENAKVAGVLVEARWRGERLDWVAICSAPKRWTSTPLATLPADASALNQSADALSESPLQANFWSNLPTPLRACGADR